MKTGLIEKTAGQPDMDKINQYTRKTLSPDDVYTFPITLCDNEIDRDLERFSVPALCTLAKLYLGKTGIFDHNPKAENQAARIYDTEVIRESGRKTAAGEEYHKLTAMAYMLQTEKNADLIAEIDGGIKKEVSVGCEASKLLCSRCGANQKNSPCSHAKGVDGVHYIWDDPTDAFEWSFVAVPAQRNAGVTKRYAEPPPDTERETQISAILVECDNIMKQFETEEKQ